MTTQQPPASTPPKVGIFYVASEYSIEGKRLLGRHSATAGFLKAWATHSRGNTLYAYTSNKKEFENFRLQVQPWSSPPKACKFIPMQTPQSLQHIDVLYRPDPALSQLAWERRTYGEASYSLCGVTHSLCSKETMAQIGNLLISPLNSWDSLICTSQGGKAMINGLLEDYSEYLAQRWGTRPEAKIHLPVIPLGVDCDSFEQNQQRQGAGYNLKEKLNIGEGDLVVIFAGRLNFYTKAHPVPMYQALERAAGQVEQKVHLIQAGWFEGEGQEREFKESAREFCPSVQVHFLNGRAPEVRQNIWCIGDIFISLADNIQETFGLTPIEAMASGIPVIVTDWNGYKESVRDEVDGFRIPTIMAPLGCGKSIAESYSSYRMNHNYYIGHVAIMTSVDIEACSQALVRLLSNPELRQRMGENGRSQARQVYDWSVVIKAYEELWQYQSDLRLFEQSRSGVQAPTVPNPLCDDPCRRFAHYPTGFLEGEDRLALGVLGNEEGLRLLGKYKMTGFGGSHGFAY